jgi:polyhydroxyalkanoate synthase subunit PhaC
MATQTNDPTRWFSELLAAQQSMLQQATSTSTAGDSRPTSGALLPWLPMTTAFVEWQQQLMKQFNAWWAVAIPGGGAAAGTSASDRRFAAEPWKQDPRFDALARSYLTQSEMLRDTLAAAPLDERSKAQWGFVLRQVIDALSPANALATNPEALQTAIETGGTSLVQGMQIFMQDFAKGRVSMTDDTAFEVGRDVATTPGSVVFENELVQLLQYAPTTARVHERPLLIVPPCINKFYILDLQPENSFVAYAVAQGHTAFLVSWRNIGPDQQRLGWDDYLEQGVMQAIDVALAISGADRVNTLGFCVGGTLLASALAVMTAKHVDKVASMTLLTTMLDFADTGELGLLISEQSVSTRERAIGQGGLLKGKELAQVFAALRANDLIWPYVVSGYLKGRHRRRSTCCSGTPTTRTCRARCSAGTCATLISKTSLVNPARPFNAACRSTWARSRCRRSCTPRARITSCPGRRPTGAPACSAATSPSCWAAAAILPGSSTRRRRGSATTGSARSSPTPATGLQQRATCPAVGGQSGSPG